VKLRFGRAPLEPYRGPKRLLHLHAEALQPVRSIKYQFHSSINYKSIQQNFNKNRGESLTTLAPVSFSIFSFGKKSFKATPLFQFFLLKKKLQGHAPAWPAGPSFCLHDCSAAEWQMGRVARAAATAWGKDGHRKVVNS
jgi:hypothetical protein